MGDRGPDWLASHMIQFALSKHAIIISADYRLLPEASGSEMLTDICVSLWEWMLNSFPAIVSKAHPGMTPDLTRIMATGALKSIGNISRTTDTFTIGESAGGYLATQLALAHPSLSPSTNKPGITALVLAYPLLDLLSPFFLSGAYYSISKSYTIIGISPPLSTFTNHIAAVKAGRKPSVVTDGIDPESGAQDERVQMGMSAVLHGKLPELLGLDNEDCFPIERIGRSGTARNDGSVRKTEMLPRRVWIYHGSTDHVVPPEGSRRFVDVVRENLSGKGTEVKYYEDIGGDHVFDVEMTLDSESNGWLREGYDWVEAAWLGFE